MKANKEANSTLFLAQPIYWDYLLWFNWNFVLTLR